MLQYCYPKIANIVTLWDLQRKTTIEGLSGKTKKRFNADVIKDGKQRLLVFESGKIIATGCKTIKLAKLFCQRAFPDDKVKFLKVINMTGSGWILPKINVIEFVRSGQNITYEPEIYPGIYWRENKLCVTYYPKGSYVITGVKSRKQLRETFLSFYGQFKKYIKDI